jgi:pimeloyl-ACP methyl ester carboxylesterase
VGVERFAVDVSQATLDDLDARLARTRWPGELDGAGWEDGTSPAFLQELVGWWQTGFDWRAQEAAINRFPQFRATVDGIGLHFVHVRGKGPAPLPLVLTHGWPSTFYELLPLVPLLTDPAGHGGDPADAFDVVIPSLPGYGFSDPLQGRGSSNRVPKLWVQLMSKVLGYKRFGAHGGDIGAMVANRLALEHPERLVGIHVTRAADPYVGPGAAPLTIAEQALLAARARWHEAEGGYVHRQRTRPQTLAYGLADSPVGLAAWILEKWQAWSDCDGQVERRFTKDQLLTTVMLYWVTGTIGPSFRFHRDWALGSGSLPQALAEALADRAEVPPWVVRPLALRRAHPGPGRGDAVRLPLSPGVGPSGPMVTCAASPTCPAAATSRPWRSPSCWPRTCAGSSGPAVVACSWVAWPQRGAAGVSPAVDA